MKKNIIISVFAIVTLVAISRVSTFIAVYTSRNFRFPVSGVLINMLLPIVFGFLISFPFRKMSTSKLKLDYYKLLTQGIPALMIAIPWRSLIIIYVELTGESVLSFGVFDKIVGIMSRFQDIASPFAGVWLGKVIADSIGTFELTSKPELPSIHTD